MNVQVVTEDYFCGHQGTDLLDVERANFRYVLMSQEITCQMILAVLSLFTYWQDEALIIC